jgi:hypothetical protein
VGELKFEIRNSKFEGGERRLARETMERLEIQTMVAPGAAK